MYIEGIESFLNIETGEVGMLRTFDRETVEDKRLQSTLLHILSGGKKYSEDSRMRYLPTASS